MVRMADIIKRVSRKVFPKFNIPKIIVGDKHDKEIALLGEVNTENLKAYELPERIKERIESEVQNCET